MATVTGMTAAAMEVIRDASVVDGEIDAFGHLILTTYGGTDLDAGYMIASVPDASATVKGLVELATDAEAITGTDIVRAVTPHALAAAASGGYLLPDASTTFQGKVELATSAETITGTDVVRAVTPAGLAALISSLASKLAMTGEMKIWAGATAPTDWLFADGSSLLISSYTPLYNVIVPVLGTATITIATPGVVTKTAHGLIAGDVVVFTTTGALPTGLSIGNYYFVLATSLTADTFRLSSSDGGAAINTSGSQSGVHTLRRAPYGIADSTHFWIPPMNGRVPVGRDASQTEFVRLGKGGGSKTHTLTTAEMPVHSHDENVTAAVGGAGVRTDYDTDAASSSFPQGITTGNAGSGGAHNNLQPYLAMNYIIKT